MAGEITRSTFTLANLFAGASKAVAAGEITKLGEYVVTAGEEISVGNGILAGQDNATGRIFAKFMTASGAAEVTGTVRFHIYSSQNRPIEITHEFRTEDLNTSDTNRTLQLPLPEHAVWLREDQKLVLEFIADSAATITKADSKLTMSMTRKMLG